MRLILAVLLTLAAPAAAQHLPQAYSVTGVAPNDVLNIRAAPDAQSAILGTLGPYALNIEVLQISDDGRWGMVSVPEGNGWVNLRFLAIQPGPAPGEVARPMLCLGTEPFWSINFTVRGTEYNDPETGHPVPLEVKAQDGGDSGYFAHLTQPGGIEHRLIIRRDFCSDGMSDRLYGLSALRFTTGPDGVQVERACCTLDAR